jgi:hypothetical protein
MSTLLIIGVWLLVAAAATLILYSLCIAAGRADQRAREALKRERLAKAARDKIDADFGGGFRRR